MPARYDQNNFRGRNDDGDLTTATWKAAENTNFRQKAGVNFRVRFGVDNVSGTANGTFTPTLQYSRNSGAWTNVTTTSTVVKFVADGGNVIADDAATSQLLTPHIGSSGAFVAGRFDENGSATGATLRYGATTGDYTEYEFCLQIIDADTADNDTIQLRVGSALYSYTQTPTITVGIFTFSVSPSSGSGSTQQFTYTYTNANGYTDVKNGSALTGVDTSGVSTCHLVFFRVENQVWLARDNGLDWDWLTIGGAGTLENSQCSVIAADVSASGAGNNWTVLCKITFKSAYAGAKNIYMRGTDQANVTSDWALKGTWTVPSGTTYYQTLNAIPGNSPLLSPASMFLRVLNAAQAGGASFIRSIPRNLVATAGIIGSIVRRVGWTLGVAGGSAATLAAARAYVRTLAATQIATAMLATRFIYGRMLSAASSSVAVIVRSVGKVLQTADAVGTVLARRIFRTLSTSTASATSLIAQKVKMQLLSAAQSSLAMISRRQQLTRAISAVQASVVCIQRKLWVTLMITNTSLATLWRECPGVVGARLFLRALYAPFARLRGRLQSIRKLDAQYAPCARLRGRLQSIRKLDAQYDPVRKLRARY